MQKQKTLSDFFFKNLKDNSKKKIFEIETKKSKTFKQIYEKSKKISCFLDIKQGDIITVILPNSIDYIEVLLASSMGGYVFNPLPYFVDTVELKTIFKYINPNLIVTDRSDIKKKFKKEYNFFNLKESLHNKRNFNKKKINENWPAAIYYSSGTTGNPKGVIYSHKNTTSLISSIIRGFKFSNNDKQLAFLPFGHTASINYNILPSLMVGCDLYISRGFEYLRSSFFNVLSEYKISFTDIVPTVLFVLNKLNFDLSKVDLSNLKFIGCSSSTLPLTAQIQFINKYKIKIANLYGLSESGPSHIDYPLEKNWKPGSIGMPLDVNKCKIDKNGEILLKGDNIFLNYHKNPALYKEVVKKGWFYTGDLGKFEKNKFWFVDRKKDLIIKGGINIVPMEIEEIIYKNSNVEECVVVGKFDKIQGENVVAVIKKKNNVIINNDTLTRQIISDCKKKLSNYKIPSHIFFWKEIPKTASKKLLRKKVRDEINK